MSRPAPRGPAECQTEVRRRRVGRSNARLLEPVRGKAPVVISTTRDTTTMDLLFAKALGDTALVRTRACDDPRKGKGVFALVPSVELSEAAIDDDKDLPPSVMDTCATCG